eukprot:symbB.v1.2.006621.t1/scaffold390.1/size254036/17
MEVPGVPPGFDKTWQRVHVRNTFIEVDEEPHSDLTLSGLDLHNAPGRTWRRGHLRCASEPMSFFLSQPPWEPVSLNTPPFSMPSGALPTGDSRGERGRPCPHRSLNQMTQMTIQESLEEYEERESLRNSLPQYVGMKSAELRGQNTGEQGTAQSAWCGEPWLVDVTTSPGFLEHREEEGRSSPEWSAPSVPTLALPLRFRHARQRSRTIQEDTELDALDALDAPKVHPGLPWNSLGERVNGVNVRVRNTFIEVDEGSDGCTDPSVLSARPAWRPGHLRCASEPIPSYPAESRIHSGFHSRSSSYQDDDVAEILQAQLGQSHDDPHLGQNSHGDVFPFVHSQHGSVGNVGNDTQNPDSHASPDQIHEQRGLHPAVSPLSQDLAQTSPAEHHGNSPPAKTSLCKWHSRGTCKYGDSCRFSHSKNVKSTKSKSETLRAPASTGPQAPLPAGLVPGVGAPFPVGAVSPEAPKPQPAGLLPQERQPSQQESSASRHCRSVSPVSTTAGSSAGDAADGETDKAGLQRNSQSDKSHQVFWCDARAFKHEFQGLREELESAIGVAAKSHKTAEKCMRLLKKKQRVQAERGRKFQKARPLIFLVSWANAQELVDFLQEAQHMPPLKVVVLCDTNGPRTRGLEKCLWLRVWLQRGQRL